MTVAGLRSAPVARFRFESDLVDVLHPQLARSLFSPKTRSEIEVFQEVPAVHGVPDLTAIRFDARVVEARLSQGVRPLTTDTEVRAVRALLARPATPSELASRLRMSRDYVHRGILPLLEDLGWIERRADEVIGLRSAARPAGRRVVVVEAKLKNWMQAIGQARRLQLSADAAYVALDARRLLSIDAHVDAIAESGIGLISVEAGSGRVRVLARPKRSPLASDMTTVGRMLIAERCLGLLAEGRRQGQVYPVFGWTRSSDTI